MGKDSQPILERRVRLPLLLHWWWLFWEPSVLGPRSLSGRKSWRVVYNDEKPYPKSVSLSYGKAVDIARTHGGHIERVESWGPPTPWGDAE